MTTATSDHLERFYSLLAHLANAPGQGRPLVELPTRSLLPERGVYYFREPGEHRAANPNVLRVVRVGTHAVSSGSKSTLHGRLKAHLGTRTGGGNHRGSIFRRHVGDALLARDGIQLKTWGVGSSPPPAVRNDETARAAENALEKRVSEHIGAMPVLWVNVPDEPGRNSKRAFIERNAIALISNQLDPIDKASENWLGRFSPRGEIRTGGLWNLNHVGEDYDASFLDILESYVGFTCGGEPRLSLDLKAEGRKWFDGLRRFVSECRARRPVVDREDLSAFEEIQCRIIGGSLIAWLREHGPRLVHERAVLAEFQNCETDPIIVFTSGQPGLVAVREILRKGPANIVSLFPNEFSDWLNDHPDPDYRWHIHTWSCFEPVDADTAKKAKKYPCSEGESLWLHKEGTTCGHLFGRGGDHLWKWNGREPKLLEEGMNQWVS